MTERLTRMQQRYIWLAGSYPKMVVSQGRGVRGGKTLYAIDEASERLVIFGYSNPLYFLESRKLFRTLQENNAYTLTDAGESLYREILIRGDGGGLNEEIRRVELKPR